MLTEKQNFTISFYGRRKMMRTIIVRFLFGVGSMVLLMASGLSAQVHSRSSMAAQSPMAQVFGEKYESMSQVDYDSYEDFFADMAKVQSTYGAPTYLSKAFPSKAKDAQDAVEFSKYYSSEVEEPPCKVGKTYEYKANNTYDKSSAKYDQICFTVLGVERTTPTNQNPRRCQLRTGKLKACWKF